jgi:hypothetical protein
MAYDLEGCFEKDGSNGYQAHWTDPCGGADITACMELVSGVWQPNHLITIGSVPCTPDSICCKKTDTGWIPVLRFNSYSNLSDVIAGCCACTTSTPCFGDTGPAYIDVTFSGITECAGHAYSPNATYTLELAGVTDDASSWNTVWVYPGGSSYLGFYVMFALIYDKTVMDFRIYVEYSYRESNDPVTDHWYFRSGYAFCDDGHTDCCGNTYIYHYIVACSGIEGPFNNCLEIGSCSNSGISGGYGGTATIDYSPCSIA